MTKPIHTARSLLAIVPQYTARFSCIGPDCSDTCCAGWGVAVDKTSYKAWREAEVGDLVQRFQHSLKIVKGDAKGDAKSEATWALMQLQPSGACPFLEGGACSIQNHMGEGALCDTCFTYPRGTWELGGDVVQTLTLSCPEAARLALTAPDAMELVESTVHVRDAMLGRVKPVKGLTPAQMSDVHVFCMRVLRVKELALWQRLAVLGLFCGELTKLLDDKKPGDVEGLVKQFVATVESGGIAAALDAMQPNHALQAQGFLKLLQLRGGPSMSSSQNQVQQAVLRGLGANDDGTLPVETLVQRYTVGVRRLDEALKDAPFFLEHYLVNDVIRMLFPFQEKNPLAHYMQLVSRFGMVRLMLAARCADGPLPSLAELVVTTQAFCRRFQHDPKFAAATTEALEGAGFANLEKLYGFLRA